MTRKSITRKFVIGFIIAAILLAGVTMLLNYEKYSNNISEQYQETAYQIAASVSDWVTPEMLIKYVEVSESGDPELISETIALEEYNELWNKINNLRKSMELNDIYIVYYTAEDMRAFDDNRDAWQPLHYLFDCFSTEEEAFQLGDVSSMNPDNRELFAEVPESGQKQSEQIISKGEFGYNTSALLPVLDKNGKTVAVIGVELPMRTLEDRVKNYIAKTMVSIIVEVILIMMVFVFVQYRSIIVPIKLIAEEAKIFGETGDTVSEKLKSMKKTGDEIQALSDSIVGMEEGIIAYVANIERITAEKERISAELNVATQIQADMLPRIFPPFPERDEFDIYATMTPAKEVGGDFYDFFLVDDNHLAVVMADVSGKGVPAALFMVIAKTLIKNRTQRADTLSPGEILADVNEQLCEGNETGLFVTVWLGILDVTNGKGIEANAGHEYPAIRRANGKFELCVYKHSPVVAAIEGIRFKDHEFELYPGDTLYVYTDGVPEATDANDELYGTERMLEALNKKSDADPKQLLENVKEGIDGFVMDAPQFDDITMLALTYFGGHDK